MTATERRHSHSLKALLQEDDLAVSKMAPADILDTVLHALPSFTAFHACHTTSYRQLTAAVRPAVEALFSSESGAPRSFGPFGLLSFPYRTMGKIDSLDLFGLDELIIFAFYWTNRQRYHRVLDFGANIGLHSVLMARCGFGVTAYEPDPDTYAILCKNLELNDCRTVRTVQAAVAAHSGTRDFVRVLGNRTGSHLAGAKLNPYGALETISVRTVAFRDALSTADLIKMDVEGVEAEVIASTERADWDRTDMLLEIGSEANAISIFETLSSMQVNIFAQRQSWSRVRDIDAMPKSYKDGIVFISRKSAMPWPHQTEQLSGAALTKQALRTKTQGPDGAHSVRKPT